MRNLKHSVISVVLYGFLSPALAQESVDVELSIAEQPLSASLREVADSFDLTIAFYSESTDGLEGPALEGEYTSEAAFDSLLADTNLEYTFISDSSVAVRPIAAVAGQGGDSDSKNLSPTPVLMAQNQTSQTQTSSGSEKNVDDLEGSERRIPEIIVRGRNVGVERTEDDSQPFVTFEAEEINRSSATSVEDFLRTRLPQNTNVDLQGVGVTDGDSRSLINLRGLGADQTLILINGRRTIGTSVSSFDGVDFRQPDINGIPLSAIERIEVLPATASAIYGGGATGGVINIVLRLDYSGLEVSATYDNSFDTDSSIQRYELTGGTTLAGGKTNLTFAASYSSANDLLVRDRDFAHRSRQLQISNNPDFYLSESQPPLARLPNISAESEFDFDFFQETGGIRFIAPDLILDDGTELGSPITFVGEGYPGVFGDGGAALVPNAGLYNFDIANGTPRLGGGGASLFSAPDVLSLSMSLRQEFSDRFDAYLDASYSSNEGSSPATASFSVAFLDADAVNNPFQQNIRMTFPLEFTGFENTTTSESLSIAGGFAIDLGAGWSGALDVNYNSNELRALQYDNLFGAQLFSSVSSGAIDVLRDLSEFPIDFGAEFNSEPSVTEIDSSVTNYAFRFGGAAYELPGGDIQFTGLVEHRSEAVEDSIRTEIEFDGEPVFVLEPAQSRDVFSVYAETHLPLISSRNAIPFARLLELQLAVRYDEYTTKALADRSQRPEFPDLSDRPESVELIETKLSSIDYTLSGRYSPVEGITLRTSFSTGFLPPSLSQLIGSTDLNRSINITDPKRDNAPNRITVPTFISFGSPSLDAEESESFSFGAIFEPTFAPSLRLSIDYLKIEKGGEIASIGSQAIVDREDQLPGRVIRAPLEPDAPPEFTAGNILLLDSSLVNIAESEYEFVDLNIDYTVRSDIGEFSIFANAVKNLDSSSRILESDNLIDNVGFLDGPRKWQFVGGLNWTNDDLWANWTTRYFDSSRIYSSTTRQASVEERIINNGGNDEYGSRVVHDVQVGYNAMLFSSDKLTRFVFGIRNVFDEEPPIAPEGNFGGIPQQFSNGVDPRLRTFFVTVKQQF